MTESQSLPRLQSQSLGSLRQPGLPPLPHDPLPSLSRAPGTSIVKVENQLIACDGDHLRVWGGQNKQGWVNTQNWNDGLDETTQLLHMQLIDRTLILLLSDGQVQLWRKAKGHWLKHISTTHAELQTELAKSNTRTAFEFALEHKYTIAVGIAAAVVGAFYIYRNHQRAKSEQINGTTEITEKSVASVQDTSVHEICTPSVCEEHATTVLEKNTQHATHGILEEPLLQTGRDETEDQRVLNRRRRNQATPDELKEVANKTAQEVNSAVYNRRHQELAERYENEKQSATKPRVKAEMSNKLKSLEQQEFMDTVAMFSRKDGSEVLVVGNVKTRAEAAKDPSKIKYADDGFGWSQADKQVIVDTIRSKPEFRDANIKIIDLVDKPTNARQNAVSHAEMQWLSYCQRNNVNHKDYVGGISKPACVSCDTALSSNIRALGDGIAKDHTGTDMPSLHDVKDAYSGRKLSRYSVKPEDWVHPSSVTPTYEVINDKKRFTHNVTKDKLYGAKPELVKPNIRKSTVHHPVATAKRQNLNSLPKNAKKHTHAQASVGSFIETIIEHHDREAFADANTLIHVEPHTYRTRSTVGAAASLHTARAQAGISVVHASAEGPNLSVGAHAGPSGASAYANAEVCRAEAGVPGVNLGVGLTAKTGASVGPSGLSADLLGFGFTIGPKIRIATPLFDIALG